jgi:hypothetical protein
MSGPSAAGNTTAEYEENTKRIRRKYEENTIAPLVLLPSSLSDLGEGFFQFG